MAGGRPLKFQSVEELQKKIDAYFEECDKKREPYLITGLAVWLDCSRQTLLDYEGKPEFTDTIKRAKEKCEAYSEKQLYQGKNVAGVIFSMTNNYKDWINTQRSELTGKGGDKLDPLVIIQSK